MKFDEVKVQILEGKKICLLSEEKSPTLYEKRKIYFSVTDGEVMWTACKKVHEEKPVDNTDMIFVSNAMTRRKGSISTEKFREISEQEFSEIIQETEEEVVSADCGECSYC